ncbi:MAG: ABC transporter ATP-binding protein, partial [Fimbriimonas ginsengisoli]|nr:ABC transporter ATP-binding protein [Fimbriimonas ginsengisoli]
GYGARAVLTGVSLSLNPGRVLAILGPNGAGKSTLIRTLCGLIPPLGGGARLGGQKLQDLSPRQIAHQVAVVPQEEAHAFAFTVEQIVTMGRLALSGGFFDTPEDRAAAEQAMRQVDCLALKDRVVTELSGGERQRVLLARALAQDAPALLLDEPAAHLDVSHQIALVKTLRSLRSQGRAIMIALHDLNLAAALADDAILLDGGTIGLQAPIGDVIASPQLEEVYLARFERLRSPGGQDRIVPDFGPPED